MHGRDGGEGCNDRLDQVGWAARMGEMAGDGRRPVVLLCGWLGASPRSLRRFERLYKHLGFDTISRIAPPESVVAAVTRRPFGANDDDDVGANTELDRLAIGTLQELQDCDCSSFFVHLFSNSGCFLWETIRHAMFEAGPSINGVDRRVADASGLRIKLRGVIFDSSPAHYRDLSFLEAALRHVSPEGERLNAARSVKSIDTEKERQRFFHFWSGIADDRREIPQLFLYSNHDRLASAEHIEALIEQRKSTIGEARIFHHNFRDSEHCCHLLRYPETYERNLKSFVGFCLRQTQHQSKM